MRNQYRKGHAMAHHSQFYLSRFSRRRLLRHGITAASLAALAGTAYTTLIEPAWIEIAHVSLRLPRLAPAFCGYRIAQVSDIHLGDWMTVDRLNDVIRAVNRQAPDLIAITGDFVTRRAEQQVSDLTASLRRFHARDGVVAVLGNHDYWSDARVIRDLLPPSGVRELANIAWTLRRGSAQLHIAGVDDIWEGHDRLDLVLDALPRDGAAILLTHEPDFAEASAATGRFDLQMSGHSHGGQIVAPLLGPLHVPFLSHRYPSGRYQVGEMIQYTNRGVGMIRPFVRLNCRPEVTIFDLHAQTNCACADMLAT
jgi:predicted MPP superfamily phosphohydrolase